MTQGIAPWTARRFAPPAPVSPDERVAPHDPEPPYLLDDGLVPNEPSRATPATASNGVHSLRNERDTLTKSRLDAFRRTMTIVYHPPLGNDDLHWNAFGDMHIAVPFTMAKHFKHQESTIRENRGLVSLAAAKAHLSASIVVRVQEGRGTAREISALTQSLIDIVSEQRPETCWTPALVRRWMFDCGIGIDCAGYTQQAYLAATGLTRSGANFAQITNESLSGLEQRGFRKLASVADVRPGDIVSLSSPKPHEVGHRAIVYDQRVASASDMRALLACGGAAQAFAVGGPIRVVELDSSWGCGGDSQRGGVRRETFLYNERTGEWVQQPDVAGQSVLEPSKRVHGDDLDGFFRGKGG
ncbi:MAG: hypothetical protein M3O50_18780 [Myxococcota bacterium]|nr:hypothetical protein [Myxococcota bacterium]